MSKSFLCVQDFCPCTAFVNFLETSCYSWKPPGNGLNFTSLETVLHTKSFLGNCLVHCTFPNSVQLGNLVLFGCVDDAIPLYYSHAGPETWCLFAHTIRQLFQKVLATLWRGKATLLLRRRHPGPLALDFHY